MPPAEAFAGRELSADAQSSCGVPALQTLPSKSIAEPALRPPTKPHSDDLVASASELAQLAPNHDGKAQVLATIAKTLEREVVRNERDLSFLSAGTSGRDGSDSCSRATPFHGLKAPPIAVKEYLHRIAKHAKCSPVCFIMAYEYLQRLAKKDQQLQPCNHSVHRLLITAVVLAAKLTDDNYYNNAFYARIGGVSTAELNSLELEMLGQLDYRLSVSRHQVLHHLKVMQPSHSKTPSDVGRRSKKRVSDDTENELPEEVPPSKWQQSGDGSVVEPSDKPPLCQIGLLNRGPVMAETGDK